MCRRTGGPLAFECAPAVAAPISRPKAEREAFSAGFPASVANAASERSRRLLQPARQLRLVQACRRHAVPVVRLQQTEVLAPECREVAAHSDD